MCSTQAGSVRRVLGRGEASARRATVPDRSGVSCAGQPERPGKGFKRNPVVRAAVVRGAAPVRTDGKSMTLRRGGDVGGQKEMRRVERFAAAGSIGLIFITV